MTRSLKIKRPERASVQREAEQHSRYRTTSVYVPMTGNDNDDYGHFRVSQNIEHNVIDKWLDADDGFFGVGHRKAITRCADLWVRCHRPTAPGSGGLGHSRALASLTDLKSRVPRYAWEIFENVCRWDEPTGMPGSRFAAVRPACVRAAKHVVRYVAEKLSR